MTAGWAAFDAPTREALARAFSAGVDCFGARLRVTLDDGPVLQALTAPMRLAQLCARLSAQRWGVAQALESLRLRGLIGRDDEGFYFRFSA